MEALACARADEPGANDGLALGVSTKIEVVGREIGWIRRAVENRGSITGGERSRRDPQDPNGGRS